VTCPFLFFENLFSEPLSSTIVRFVNSSKVRRHFEYGLNCILGEMRIIDSGFSLWDKPIHLNHICPMTVITQALNA